MAQREINYNRQRFELSYEIINPTATNSILILHGWGSNKALMKQAFGEHLNEYCHIYLDLPGFGKSSNEVMLTTHDYANIVSLFLDSIQKEPGIIMGHSFGGKVATLLNPPCLVLLASSGIFVPKPLSVKLKIALTKLLKPIGGRWLRKIFVAKDAQGMPPHMYETFKYVVNEAFEGNFGKVTSNALLFWGKDDTATPLWTAKKIASLINDAKLFEYEGDHYFFLDSAKAKDIAQKIENECKGVQ